MPIGFDFGTSNTVWAHSVKGGGSLAVARRFLSKETLEDGVSDWVASLAAYQGSRFYKGGAWVRRHAEQLAQEGCRIEKSVKTRLRGMTGQDALDGCNPWAGTTEGEAASDIIGHACDVDDAPDWTQEQTVATHPFGASASYRLGLRRTLERLDFQVAYYLCEPTAALLSFQASRTHARAPRLRHCLVFDWGGGTLDVSVVRVGHGKFLEVSSAGCDIAGDRIDEIIFLDMIERGSLADIPDGSAEDALKIQAERVKVQLSTFDVVEDIRPYGDASKKYSITRERFHELFRRDILRPILETVEKALGGLRREQIDEVFMVGGSSNLPAIRDELRRLFPGRVTWHPKPEDGQSAIAEGAAAALALGARPFLAWGLVTWAPNGAPCTLLPPGLSWDELVRGEPKRLQFFLTDLNATEISIPLGYQVDGVDGRAGEARLLKALRLPAPKMARTRGCWEPFEIEIKGQSDGTLVVSAGLAGPNFARKQVSIDDAPWGLLFESAEAVN